MGWVVKTCFLPRALESPCAAQGRQGRWPGNGQGVGKGLRALGDGPTAPPPHCVPVQAGCGEGGRRQDIPAARGGERVDCWSVSL